MYYCSQLSTTTQTINRLVFRSFILLSILLYSCNNTQQADKIAIKPDKDQMEEVNRYLVQKDRERIESYLERKNINATMSDSGLWYRISNPGTGQKLDTNDTIRIEYNCSLLDGTRCYSSTETGPKRIIVGKSNIESGLDQGLRLLGRGGEALFIIPSFLAHGLLGDGDRIPAMSALVYEVRVIEDK